MRMRLLAFLFFEFIFQFAESQFSRCAAGEYANDPNAVCTTCEAGKYCPTPLLDQRQDCPTYYSSGAGNAICTLTFPNCAVGTMLNIATKWTTCVACTANSFCYHDGDIFSEVTCPFGTSAVASGLDMICTPTSTLFPLTDLVVPACAVGQFYSFGVGCVTCPASYYCPDSTKPIFLRCPTGTYSGPGSTTCTICEAGFSCGDKTLAGRTACTQGMYSIVGTGICIRCPSGYSCTTTTLTACGVAQYAQFGEGVCYNCQPGHYCAPQGSRMIPCPAGTYQPAALQTSCLACAAGTYSTRGSTGCTTCPAKFYCKYTNSLPQRCPRASGSAAGATTCTFHEFDYSMGNTIFGALYPLDQFECPIGFYCNGFTSDLSTTYSYASIGRLYQIRPCPQGTKNPFPNAFFSTDCINCEIGEFCPPGTSIPMKCPKGNVCENGVPSFCAAGKYANPYTNDECLDCDAGKYCPVGTLLPQDCPSGMFCTGSTQTACPAGTYISLANIGNAGGCLTCPHGHYCPSGTAIPIPCPPGTYNSLSGRTQSSDCLACTAGTACPQYANILSTVGFDCPPGYYCPSGTKYPNQYPCDEGLQNDLYQQTSSGACVACTAGYYCLTATNKYTNPAFRCIPGYYCPAGTTYLTMKPCPAGTYSTLYGLGSAAECQFPCPAGYFCLAASTAPTGKCRAGYYCPVGSTIETMNPCPAGTYSTTQGLKHAGECTVCPAGYYCSGISVSPLTCPITSVQAQLVAASQCTSCPFGSSGNFQYCTGLSDFPLSCITNLMDLSTLPNIMCIWCSFGVFCDNVLPITCPTNPSLIFFNIQSSGRYVTCSFGDFAVSLNLPTPAVCPSDYYAPSIPSTLSCITCGTDFYCDVDIPVVCPSTYTMNKLKTVLLKTITCGVLVYVFGLKVTTVQCPDEIFTPLANPTLTCKMCDWGYFCDNALPLTCPTGAALTTLQGAGKCLTCTNFGAYCVGTNVATVTCPTYITVPAYSQNLKCKVCTNSFFCEHVTQFPLACPAGTYSDKMELSLITQCTTCPGGAMCPTTAMTTFTECGLGFYSAAGSTACTQCTAGYYCNMPNTVAPTICAAGFLCLPQVGDYPSDNIFCVKGNYCPIPGTLVPLPCPAGTYNPARGSIPSTSCLTTPYGMYSAKAQAMPNGFCSPGYYCPAGSGFSTQVVCPAGTFRSVYGARMSTDCGTCPPGFYCPVATSTPKECPYGYYCPSGSQVPQKCSQGYFAPDKKMNDVSQCIKCYEGRFCYETGTKSPDGDCENGYFCSLSSNQFNNPTQICAAGGLCPHGTPYVLGCNAGQYHISTQQYLYASCINCPGGSYCIGDAQNIPTGLCLKGYYCSGSAMFSKQAADTPAHYSDTGATAESNCPAKRYSEIMATEYVDAINTCTECPGGFLCDAPNPNPGTFVDCPAGSYCTQGNQIQCPAGKYNPLTQRSSINDCHPCPPGNYCPVGTGAIAAGSNECLAGYYCKLGSPVANPNGATSLADTYDVCPAGFYCPQKTGYPIPCSPGTYNSLQSQTTVASCLPCTAGSYCEGYGNSALAPCDAGYYCLVNSKTKRSAATACTPGHMCPAGSPSETICPDGTYQNNYRQSSCIPCPAGYYCDAGATDFSATPCPTGKFCPLLSATQGSSTASLLLAAYQCPQGTYNPTLGAWDSTQCLKTTGGYYNDLVAQNAVDLMKTCTPGYFCPPGSINSQGAPTGGICTISNYCSGTNYMQIQCPGGYYCPKDASNLYTTKVQCNAGTYCPPGTDGTTVTPLQCPAGSYCIIGTERPYPCPRGTFSNAVGLTIDTACTQCTPGSYCSEIGSIAVTGPCNAGYYCKSSDLGANIGFTSPTPKTHICPAGYYCEAGTPDKIDCTTAANPNYPQYQNLQGQSTCKYCPSGYYCTGTTAIICKPGTNGQSFVCPLENPNTLTSMNKISCPAGKISIREGADDLVNDCYPCPRGFYCPDIAGQPLAIACQAGYYCAGGQSSTTTNQCQIGYYCPAGTAEPIPCPTGYFCDTVGMTTITNANKCSNGYYCMGGATADAVIIAGKIVECPAGYYCNNAESTQPIPCRPGTYNPSTLGTDINACLACDPTYYCNSPAMTSTNTLPCEGGFYCPSGTGYTEKYPCTPGHECPPNSATETACSVGYYQRLPQQISCVICPTRFYCSSTGMSAPTICDAGYYCPNSPSISKIACASGTFLSRTGASASSDCEPCLPGYYCPNTNMVSLVGFQCTAGYICYSGATSSTPNDGTNTPCPIGFYCAAGTTTPTPCPPGTYGDATGFTDVSFCKDCPARFHCPYYGGTDVLYDFLNPASAFLCSAGYVCLTKNYLPNPTLPTVNVANGYICPAGTYCAKGAIVEVVCGNTEYNPYTGQGSCLICPSGKMCNVPADKTIVYNCPAGSYCQNGVANPCPAGTYSTILDLELASQCTDCDPGYYCNAGQSSLNIALICPAGYVCQRGAPPPPMGGQVYDFTNKYGLCPFGHYCPTQSTAPTPCSEGYYQDVAGATTVCKDCPAGYYCDQLGMTSYLIPTNALVNPTNECKAGHYCVLNAKVYAPYVPATDGGKLCDPGNYCPLGTPTMIQCPIGTYEGRSGSAACQTCPVGYYCDSLSLTQPIICTMGNYCPAGSSTPTPCPAGTYGANLGLQSSSNCRQCPAGKYCQNGLIVGPCDGGYFCDTGMSSPTPAANPCVLGFYCSSGTKIPQICPIGKIVPVNTPPAACDDINDCTDCTAGWFCMQGQAAKICPKGFYCPTASALPTPCPVATYNLNTGGQSLADCALCPAGYYCNTTGIGDLSIYTCVSGYYCLAATTKGALNPSEIVGCVGGRYRENRGASISTDCPLCPVGYYCPGATVVPTVCDAGYYCPLGSAFQTPCTCGYYCTFKAASETPCPSGYYCPAGSAYPTECTNGFYCPSPSCTPTSCPPGYVGTGKRYPDSIGTGCYGCRPGYYTEFVNNIAVNCEFCEPGYVCLGLTSKQYPIVPSLHNGYQCPKGFYCPGGSYFPIQCQPGQFSNKILQSVSTTCVSCPPGSYNNLEGQSGCKPCGPTSNSSSDFKTCDCVGANRVYQFTTGKCLCKISYESVEVNDTDDSIRDCKPVVYPSCKSGDVKNVIGQCVPLSSCGNVCKQGKGKRIPGVGVCQCTYYDDVDSICDSTCRSNQIQVQLTFDGTMKFINPDTTYTSMPTSKAVGYSGTLTCSKVKGCKVRSMYLTSTAMYGTYSMASTLLTQSTKATRLLSNVESRNLQTAYSIQNPAICISEGDSIWWSISDTSHYPQYSSQSVLNSNPNFDYSQFTNLKIQILSAVVVTSFSFTFTQSGTYVVYDAANPDSLTVIAVMSTSQSCPSSSSYIQPLTYDNLLRISVTQLYDLVLVPNWLYIILSFILIVTIIPFIINLVYCIRRLLIKKEIAGIKTNAKKKEKSEEAEQLDNKEEKPKDEKLIEVDEQGEMDAEVFTNMKKDLDDHVNALREMLKNVEKMDKEGIIILHNKVKKLNDLIKMKLIKLCKIYGPNAKVQFRKNKFGDIKGTEANIVEEEIQKINSNFEDEEPPEEDLSKLEEFVKIRNDSEKLKVSKLIDQFQEENSLYVQKLVEEMEKKMNLFIRSVDANTLLNDQEKSNLTEEYKKQMDNMQKMLLIWRQQQEKHLLKKTEENCKLRNKLKDKIIDINNERRLKFIEMKDKYNKFKEEHIKRIKNIPIQIEEQKKAALEELKKAKEDKLKAIYKAMNEKLENTAIVRVRTLLLGRYQKEISKIEDAFKGKEKEHIEKLNQQLEKKKRYELDMARNDFEREVSRLNDERNLMLQTYYDRMQRNKNMLMNINTEKQIKDIIGKVRMDGEFRLKDTLESVAQDAQQELDQIAKMEEEELKQIADDFASEEARLLEELKEKTEGARRRVIQQNANLISNRDKLLAKLKDPHLDERERRAIEVEIKMIEEELDRKINAEIEDIKNEYEYKISQKKQQKFKDEAKVINKYAKMIRAVLQKKRQEELKHRRLERMDNLADIKALIKEKLSPDDIVVAIDRAIEDKQFAELSDLLALHLQEIGDTLQERLTEMERMKLDEIEKVKAIYYSKYKKLKEALANGSISPGEYERRVMELQCKEGDELRNIELEYMHHMIELDDELIKGLSYKHDGEIIHLVQNQREEKLGHIKEALNDQEILESALGDYEWFDNQIKDYKNLLVNEREKHIQELNQRRDLLSKIANDNQDQIRYLDAQTQKLMELQNNREKELHDKYQKEVEELKKVHDRNLSETVLENSQKQLLKDQFDRDLENKNRAREIERLRQSKKMKDKLEARLKRSDQIRKQKDLQLAVFRMQREKGLNKLLKDTEVVINITGIEDKVKDPVQVLNQKIDVSRVLFEKQRNLAGVEFAEDVSAPNPDQLGFEYNEGKDESAVDLDFDLILTKVSRFENRVTGFTDDSFDNLRKGFRIMTTKLNKIKDISEKNKDLQAQNP